MSTIKPFIKEKREIPKRITIRFNKKEYQQFISLLKKYKTKSQTGLIKQILFSEIKPFLTISEKELIIAYII